MMGETLSNYDKWYIILQLRVSAFLTSTNLEKKPTQTNKQTNKTHTHTHPQKNKNKNKKTLTASFTRVGHT